MDPQRLFGPVITRSHVIGDFDTFILHNVPYAEVRARSVQWGAVLYDGPEATGIGRAKPALQWYFGGVPYPVSKAIRIPYTYVRTWDGSNAEVTASIYLGFQDNLTDLIVPQPIPFVTNPSATYINRVGVLGPFGDFSSQVWASDPALLGSEASVVVTRSFPNDPAKSSFNSLIEAEFGWNNVNDRAQLFQPLLEALIPIDFDGPAQDSDSHNVFQYTFATLLNDPEKYSQVLFWYFGGKPYRVTKALRIPLDPGYWPPGRSSFVQDAALDSNGNPKGALVRGQEMVAQATAARAAPGKVAAAKAAATALEAANQKLSRARTAGPQAAAQQQVDQAVAAQQAANKEAADQTTAAQVPLGRALFIGFAGNDPAGG